MRVDVLLMPQPPEALVRAGAATSIPESGVRRVHTCRAARDRSDTNRSRDSRSRVGATATGGCQAAVEHRCRAGALGRCWRSRANTLIDGDCDDVAVMFYVPRSRVRLKPDATY